MKQTYQNKFVHLSLFLALLIMLLSFTACSNTSGGKKEEEPPVDNGPVFFDGFDTGKIDETVWQIATWSEHGGQTGKARCYVEDGVLHLVFVNTADGFLSAAIETKQEFLYGRWEARMKFADLPRICNAMYTIHWDDKKTAAPGVTALNKR